MRVLHYTDVLRLEEGGVVRAVLDLTAGLARAGVEVTLATGDTTDAPPEWRNDPTAPNVVAVDRSKTILLRPKTTGPELLRLAQAHDIVHLHNPWDTLNPALAEAARAAGKPYVISSHGMLDDWCMAEKALKKRVYLALFAKRLLDGAAWVHYTAQAEQQQSQKWAPRSRSFVAPLLMDLSAYSQPIGPDEALKNFPNLADEAETRLLFLSRVDPKKGVDVLIRCVAELSRRRVACRAFIAGPGNEAYVHQLKGIAEELGVADRIHFLGMVKGSLKWSLYRACDLFVLPTHQENFGIVLVEAMGSALPTITTPQVDIWQELQEHGARIAEGTVPAFSDAIANAIESLDDLRLRAAAGRETLLEWLRPERLAETYLQQYQAALRKN